MSIREEIIRNGLALLVEGGLERWSLEALASRTGCAKGLVHYHFRDKANVFSRIAQLAREQRHQRRIQAFASRGGRALDALWVVLRSEVESGEAAAWLSLGTLRAPNLRRDLAPTATDLLRFGQAAAVALELRATPEEIGRAAEAATTGLQIQLLLGEDPETVRETYHRFWLGLLGSWFEAT